MATPIPEPVQRQLVAAATQPRQAFRRDLTGVFAFVPPALSRMSARARSSKRALRSRRTRAERRTDRLVQEGRA